jgi:hypothetical protein
MKETKIAICKAFFRADEEFDMVKITKSEFRMDVVKNEDAFTDSVIPNPRLKGTGFFTDEKSYFTRNGVKKQGRIYKFVPNAV